MRKIGSEICLYLFFQYFIGFNMNYILNINKYIFLIILSVVVTTKVDQVGFKR